MAVFSCLNYKTIPVTCMEYVHPWTDSCRDGTLGLLVQSFKYSLRTYTTLYLITSILRRKKPTPKVIKETLLAILQSTVFLTHNAYWFPIILCSLRRITGSFNLLSSSLIPAFFASLIAIHVERPSRRPILCLYVTNVATETLFRMAVWRGLIKPVKHGEVLIFMLSSAVLMYLFKGEHSNDATFSVIRFAIGKEEELNSARVEEKSESAERKTRSKNTIPMYNVVSYLLRQYKLIEALPKSPCCLHKRSCLSYALKGGTKLFAIGYTLQTVLNLFFSLKKLTRKPSLLPKYIFNRQSVNSGLFLGGYTSIFRGLSCIMRWLRGRDDQRHAILAGLLAGTTFGFYPNTTAALYIMWKTLQILYVKFQEAGFLPNLPFGMLLLYSFSTSVLFHAGIFEPQNLRPAYMRFLDGLSGGRICTMDRDCMDEFGLQSSKNLGKVMEDLSLEFRRQYYFKCFGNLYPIIK